MNFSDRLFLIKRKFFAKKNILLILILSILLTVILSCVTLINLVLELKKDTYNDIIGRTLIIENVNDDTKEEIAKIEHISNVISDKYSNGVEKEASEFNQENIPGSIFLKPIIDNDLLTVTEGRMPQNNGEMICAHKFYPHSSYIDEEFNQKIIHSLYLNSEDIIGRKISITSTNEDYLGKKYEFTIVGTYANKKFDDLNTCYIMIDDYDKISSKYATISGYVDEFGEEHKEYNEYNGLMVIVEDIKYLDEVTQKLQDLGYIPFPFIELDNEFLNYLIYIPLLLGIIILLITNNIIYAFLKKHIEYNKKNYGILKSCGYTNNDILKIEKSQTVFIYLTSVVISFILYFIIYYVIQNTLLVEFVYSNYQLPIPWLLLIVVLIFFFLLFIILDKIMIQKQLKQNIQNMLEIEYDN